MRARGGKSADLAVLVVAADDGVMPQTVEAIDHIKAANVPLLVAVNKMDLQGVSSEKVKQQLSEHGVLVEEWGGDVVLVECSAKTGQGVDELLEMIRLVAEMQELKADPTAPPSGMVIESSMDTRRGALTSVVVREGTLKTGHYLVVGSVYGRIRSMYNWQGEKIKEVKPGQPAEVVGLKEVVEAGSPFVAVKSDAEARKIALDSIRPRPPQVAKPEKNDEENECLKTLKFIIKADTNGSLDALHHSLERLATPKVQIVFVHEGIGIISEADALLAQVADAVIWGFRVDVDPVARQIIKSGKLIVKTHGIIYKLIEEAQRLISGKEKEGELVRIGLAEVLKIFVLSDGTLVAGSRVREGEIKIKGKVRILRGEDQTAEGQIVSLRHEKEEVKKVRTGQECGIVISPAFEFKQGDLIECLEEYKEKG